ncbi:MAG: Gfo/Idh/MocA family oxidoreductase [Parafilimonas sp.]
MSKSELGFAIVGCGRIAERHAELINSMATLKAVCDIVPVRAEQLGDKFQCNFYNSFDELLHAEKEVDIISICTPNGWHAAQTIDVLNAGIHVLCEKPMAIRSADCKAMMLAAQENNKKLFVVKQNRYNSPVVAVKEAIEKGLLGKIFSVQLNCFWNRDKHYYESDWKGTLQFDGGTLFTQFSHFIDLLYWIVGDVKLVYALTENFAHKNIIEFEDTGVVALQFESGVLGTIHFTVNSYKKNMEGSITIFGEKGTAKIGGEYLNKLEYQCIENYELENLPAVNSANNYGTYIGSMSNHDKVYEHVIKILLNEEDAETNAYESMKTVEIIEKIYRAGRH